MLPLQRNGLPAEISQQEIRFSRWPVRAKGKSFAIQTELFTRNPWEAMESAINSEFDRRSKEIDICLSFLYQAMDFYRAYETARVSSKPLLLYYSFLNLAKAFIIYRQPSVDLVNASHGLTENRSKYQSAAVTAQADKNKNKMIYDLFSQSLGNSALSDDLRFSLLDDVLPQIVIGHRIWAHASNKSERFIRAESINFMHDARQSAVWVNIDFKRDDFKALHINAPKSFVKYSGLAGFRQVSPKELGSENSNQFDKILRFEQITPLQYKKDIGEEIGNIKNILPRNIWCIVRTIPPYRRYYFWSSEKLSNNLIDPILSVYVAIFYLGSVTRYRPNYFEDLQQSKFGNFFDEIIQTQGQQMLFHLAAEFQNREVSWPAIL